MTLTQLEYIIAVDETRHFAKASKKCYVTQPTLSMQIQKLEQELDIVIFDRSKQPVIPTGIGEKVIEQARITLQESKRIKEVINNSKGLIEGDYKLGIIPTIAPYLLPIFLKSFTEKYPKVRLIIEELTTQEILDRLSKDTLDAGVAATPLNDSDLIEDPLYYEPFYLYASKGHPLFKRNKISIKDLANQDVWLMSEGHCFRDQVIQMCKKMRSEQIDIDKVVRFESGNFQTLIRLVEQNYGVTLLPHLAAQELRLQKQKEMLKEFSSPVPTREVSLIYRRSFVKKSINETLQNEIIEKIPEALSQRTVKNQILGPLS